MIVLFSATLWNLADYPRFALTSVNEPVLVILVWVLTGPMFHFSDTWQLVINTATTIVTFLMVFMIQNTQNRDAKTVHLKLDELIRAIKNARNELVYLEDLPDEELKSSKNNSRPCVNGLRTMAVLRVTPNPP